jgi:hypothetical protein
MECMAMRIDVADDSRDLADIRTLMQETGLVDAPSILEAVERFYPAKLITPRIAFGVEQIAAEYQKQRAGVPAPKNPRRGRSRRPR